MVETQGRRRVALVTGAEQGIGRGVSDLLRRRGWTVHGTVHSEDNYEPTCDRLGVGRTHLVELEEPAAARRAVDSVVKLDTKLDAVVHAVGPYWTSPLERTSPAQFEAMLRGNLFTALHVIDPTRMLLRQSQGVYLFFGCAGLERWRARKVTTAYIAAKSALLVAMRGLALEEAPHGVRANMISPGFVPHEGAAPDTVDSDLHDQIPIGRPAEMHEITETAAWLLSEDASHVVGQNIEVAGGWML